MGSNLSKWRPFHSYLTELDKFYFKQYFHQSIERTTAPLSREEQANKVGTDGSKCFSINENSKNLDSKP